MAKDYGTQEGRPGDQVTRAPAISLPKGGGAIRGIGEKFAANPVMGTGSMSVPIATSPGRSGFGPKLALSYDSGAGNGPFGFGWSLSLPSIARKTDKGLPQYRDADDSDVYVLSGSEDLVPVYRQDPDGTWVAGHPGFQRDPAGSWVRDPSGHLVVHEDELDGYRIRRYRPRIEGLFARIERWTRIGKPGDVHWRSISHDNILTLYGHGDGDAVHDAPRIADPQDPSRVFSWLICETRDDRGNGVLYRYNAEDGAGVMLDAAHERNRGSREDTRRTANRYLKRILYGNRRPLFDRAGGRPRFVDEAQIDGADWMFEVVLDYGEHDPASPAPDDAGEWNYRPDPFSSYRSGFEVRTTRLCRRVLMFHHFPGEAGVGADCLVRSTDFTYADQPDPTSVDRPVYSFLNRVTHTGYRRNNAGYDQRSLPPVEFDYTQPTVQNAVEEVDPEDLDNLPIGLDGGTYRWADLHGEGVPGILTEQAGAWYYKRNLSPISDSLPGGTQRVRAKFDPLEVVALKPNAALSGGAELMDLAGDGQPDVVVMDGPVPGLYEHDEGEGWLPYRPFTSRLNRATRDPNVRLVDLNGDGHADVLITEHDVLVWHPSLGEAGFGPARPVAQALDEEKGPRVVFADGTQSIYLADLSGDGLTDLVRIRNGEVCYWPNLGYGRFGAKVSMDHAPWFDHPDQFDHERIRLADIDGSGTTDIIYLHREGVRLYFNQSGNCWSEPQVLKAFPRIDDVVNVLPVDLLGNGTACLVWSSSSPADDRRTMRYVDLMGGRKPHLLIRTANNLGAETTIDYAPSTRFYLLDKRAGKPWITRLPFPVHVVERVTTFDHISRNRFVTRYAYHHGHFDGEEREFRGFGMVEQWDTEQFGVLAAPGPFPQAENVALEAHVPPIRTRTWFHTGIHIGRDHVSDYFAGLLDATDPGEYFREPGLTDAEARAMLLPDTILPPGLSLDEEREACRALKGLMLRQEVYADDAGPGATAEQVRRALTPYSVTEQSFSIRTLQPRGGNQHAVFFTHAREAISWHYERNPADPRSQHAMTLEVDDFGNVLKQAAIGYGRRRSEASLPTEADRVEQALVHITYTENSVTNAVSDLADHYRAPLPAESRTYELRKPVQDRSTGNQTRLLRFVDLEANANQAADGAHDIAYEDLTFARAQETAAINPKDADNYFRRLIEHARTLYRPDDCGKARNDPDALLPVGRLEKLALPGESYKLALTPGLLDQVFQRQRVGQAPEDLLPRTARASVLGGTAGDQGGYVDLDGDGSWWVPSGRSFYHPVDVAASGELAEARNHFFLPRRYRDPFGQESFVDFDSNDLLTLGTCDVLGNRVTVDVNDYRVLQPRLVSDPNGNRSEVAFDLLGLVVGTAVMGKPLPAPVEGDSLNGFVADPTLAQTDMFMGEPRRASVDPRVSEATPIVYDLLKDATTRIVYDLDRFMRLGEPSFAATIARETHTADLKQGELSRLQISFSYSDGFGREIQKKIQAEPGPLIEGGPVVSPRWVGSGWTIFNNKGKPVRRYEPFFSARPRPDGTLHSDHRFEFGSAVGVSPVLFYDPAERVIATLHPNGTYEKLVFDPWQQTTYDVNDTCAPRNGQTGDPRTDPDISGYVKEHFRTQPVTWKTWYAKRLGDSALGTNEQVAATRAAAHADTPTTAHLDALGRPFLTVARNRVACAGHDLDGDEEAVATRVTLDIEGNQREVRDERRVPVHYLPGSDVEQRVVMAYGYDMLGSRIHQRSMEAGARWILNDVTGKPIRAWDSRGHNFTTVYDEMRRPVGRYVLGTTNESDPRTLSPPSPDGLLVEKIEYGEPPAGASASVEHRVRELNLRTRILRQFDSAGVATNAALDAAGRPREAYDFKGNLLHSTRRLATRYQEIPDWSQTPQPAIEDERFESTTHYDALNRPIQSVAPHSDLARAKRNVIQPVFNEANLLERMDVWLERAEDPSALLDPADEAPSRRVGVDNIDYDAKGQRLRIEYKNGASTRYRYDPETFRLTHLYTRRGAAFSEDCDNPQAVGTSIPAPKTPPPGTPCGLQNLRYTYDPAGNITHIQDDAQRTIFFRNQRVEPSNDYVYDALYKLIQASGREHLGQNSNGDRNAPTAPDAFNAFHMGQPQPNDLKAMGRYVERYVYDAVGNFLTMQHRGADPAHPGWTRAYEYNEPSLIEDGMDGRPLKFSNRLTRTRLNPNGSGPPQVDPYQHDAHGNMVRMPHLGGRLPDSNMHWDYRDQLQWIDLGGGSKASYVYDASGQRVRKVWEKPTGSTEERIYQDGFEVFRKHDGPIGPNGPTLERETLHVMDDRQRIALVETRTLGNAREDKAPGQLIRYQLGNHLGSVSLELDDQAWIISYEEYAPYGSTTYQAVRSQQETPKRYRYAGKERDETSGLNYNHARYYASWLARWVSCDPAGVIDGPQLYAFVRNSPASLTDSSGCQSEEYLRRLTERRGIQLRSKNEPYYGYSMLNEVSSPSRSESDQASFERIMTAKATVRAAQIATTISLAFLGGELVGPALALAPRWLQVGVAVAGTPGVFMSGVGATEALTGTSILNERLDLGERLERAAYSLPGLLTLGMIEAEALAAVPREHMMVYRFATRADPQTLRPNITKSGWLTRFAERIRLLSPSNRSARAEAHMGGLTENSPFVSMLKDPVQGAKTPDPWLGKIITGVDRHGLAPQTERAPQVGKFSVPVDKLINPARTNRLSRRETEMLFLGDDLERFAVGWSENPFKSLGTVKKDAARLLFTP